MFRQDLLPDLGRRLPLPAVPMRAVPRARRVLEDPCGGHPATMTIICVRQNYGNRATGGLGDNFVDPSNKRPDGFLLQSPVVTPRWEIGRNNQHVLGGRSNPYGTSTSRQDARWTVNVPDVIFKSSPDRNGDPSTPV